MFSGGGRGQGLPAETEVLGQAWTRRGVTPLREASSSSVGWAEPLCWVLQPSSGEGWRGCGSWQTECRPPSLY